MNDKLDLAISESHQAPQHAEFRAIRSRGASSQIRLLPLLISFALGSALTLSGALLWLRADAASSRASEASQILRTKGQAGDFRTEKQSDAVVSRASTTVPPMWSAQKADGASIRESTRTLPLAPALGESSTRTAAQAALEFTTFIRGDGLYGAGVVIDEHHVLTCLHVVDEMKKPELVLGKEAPVAAEIVARDKELDLAVLRVETAFANPARLASVTDLQVGDPIFAMGAPRKMAFTFSRGVVSFLARPYLDVLYLQTDVASNGGSSGGPLMDDQGRVVAISSFILRDSYGLSFALPIDYAYRRFADYFSHHLEDANFDGWLAQHGGAGAPEDAPAKSAKHAIQIP